MYKVMIVDDEPKLRNGLRTLIPWESIGFEVIGTAASGKEVLRSFDTQLPDLLIVDIRIPGMSGLQLIQEIRTLGIPMRYVIVSGYADFEYARTALQLGADGYLLKPVNKDEMTSLLVNVREKMVQERQQQSSGRSDHRSKEWLIYSLLSGSSNLDESTVQDMAIEYELNWPEYEMVLVEFRGEASKSEAEIHRFREQLADVFNRQKRGVVLDTAAYIALLLKNPLEREQEKAELYKELQQHLSGELRPYITVAAGGKVKQLLEIRQSYTAAQSLLEKSFFYGEGAILCPDTTTANLSHMKIPERCDLPDVQEWGFRLFYLIDVGDGGNLEPLLKNAAQIYMNKGCSEQEVKKAFFQMINEVMRRIPEKTWNEANLASSPAQFLSSIYGHRTLARLIEDVLSVLEKLSIVSGSSGQHSEIKKMLDFIDRHFAENLKLETLARMFNYSSAYLGQVFKNKTGEYFNTYLDKVRIQKAKEWLAQGDKVYEAAEKAGFSSVNYFYSKFKKYDGKSPSDYQKKMKTDGSG
ncbi:response regulator transcription factor [Paenibacillus fonticola]|uniref:response regulator transcription factor n=1 Tax=Paenibacillus fonticola TaxID=379896 RepID=UPI0003766712|nr:response regulator transcription factor [Paenibacillus fonticola]